MRRSAKNRRAARVAALFLTPKTWTSTQLPVENRTAPRSTSPWSVWCSSATGKPAPRASSSSVRLPSASSITAATLSSLFATATRPCRSEEHTSELQSPDHLVCRLLLEKKKKTNILEVRNTTVTTL